MDRVSRSSLEDVYRPCEVTYRPGAGVGRYSATLQQLMPVRKNKVEKSVMPVDSAGLVSTVTFSWLTRIMWRAYKCGITLDDLPRCSPLDSCEYNARRLEFLWTDEMKRRGAKYASLQRVIWRFIRTRVAVSLLVTLLYLLLSLIGPTIFMRKLLEYAEDPEARLADGVRWTVALIASELLRVACFAALWGINYRTGVRLRSACVTMVYRKLLRLPALGSMTVGQVVNLFANDAQRVFELCVYGPLIITGPVVALGGVVYIGCLLGPHALIGMLVFAMFYPFQFALSRISGFLRRRTIAVTDERVRLMNEVLSSIRMIKQYAWEHPFHQRITDRRADERVLLERAAYVQSVSIALAPTVPIVAAIVTFLAHVAAGNDLTASQAFPVIAYCFGRLRPAISMNLLAISSFWQCKPTIDRIQVFSVVAIAGVMNNTLRWSASLKDCVEALDGFSRIQRLLMLEERQPYLELPEDLAHAVVIRGADFAWDSVQDPDSVKAVKYSCMESNGKKKKTATARPMQKFDVEEQAHMVVGGSRDVLFDINMVIAKGSLVGVCGSVGSGKSSLLSAVLGLLRLKSGKVALDGSCAYVSQQSWVLNGTVKDNICFGHRYDARRYYQTLEACCLQADLTALPYGDSTVVGERGTNLSGGQKQRLALARALYADREIYLLDDPLAAVDAHVGLHIFSEYIVKALSTKTVIFVTHQLQYLSQCDVIYLLRDGRIAESGPHSTLITTENGEYSNLVASAADHRQHYSRLPATVSASVSAASWEDLTSSRPASPSAAVSSATFSNVSNDDMTLLAAEVSQTATPVVFRCGSRSSYDMNSAAPTFQSVSLNDGDLSRRPDPTQVSAGQPRLTESVAGPTSNSGLEEDGKQPPSGAISWSVYQAYITAGGGYSVVALVLLVFILNVGSTGFSTWWLAHWLRQGAGRAAVQRNISGATPSSPSSPMDLFNVTSSPAGTSDVTTGPDNVTGTSPVAVLSDAWRTRRDPGGSISDHPHLHFYQTVYGLTVGVILVTSLLRGVIFMKVTLRASSVLHDRLCARVFRACMAIFDSTPVGKIINLFSRDMDEIDVRLPFLAETLLQNGLLVLTSLLFVSLVFPWFLVPLLPLAVVFAAIRTVFRVGMRDLKRLESGTRAPIYSHVITSVQGLATIHAFNKSKEFANRFMSQFDESSTVFYLFHCSMRWVAVRLDSLTVCVTALTAVFVLATHGTVPAALAGLALAYATQMSGIFQYTVRLASETEARFTSVERIHSYTQTLHAAAEEGMDSDGGDEGHETVTADTRTQHQFTPPMDWPQHGRVSFRSVSMRYRPHLPLVLNGVSFDVRAQEKIGIVGRTGAGKSSIGTALFRLSGPLSGGRILVDGLDISWLPLSDIRSRISIIPQDPVMFAGTVRYNLDPLRCYSDDQIWRALSRCSMRDRVYRLQGGLLSCVQDGGGNFSVGERQLLCMARALLRHSKILLMDEATAAIDSETDHLIQNTVRDVFFQCTLLTIAHRLYTVMSCHRVLVLSEGRVVEFDTPDKLLSRPQSVFAAMVTAATASNDTAAMVTAATASNDTAAIVTAATASNDTAAMVTAATASNDTAAIVTAATASNDTAVMVTAATASSDTAAMVTAASVSNGTATMGTAATASNDTAAVGDDSPPAAISRSADNLQFRDSSSDVTVIPGVVDAVIDDNTESM